MNYLRNAMIAAGSILLIGTAGASDMNLISFEEILIRAGVSVLLLLGGMQIGARKKF